MKELIQYPAGKTEESYIISNGISVIYDSAFSGSNKLKNVVIPDSVRNVNRNAFFYCENLSSITFQSPFCLIDDTESTICNGYDEDDAFLYCTYLKTVNIPKGIGIITEGTFSNCVSLENISIPDNVIRIGSFAFEECDSLTRITIIGTRIM